MESDLPGAPADLAGLRPGSLVPLLVMDGPADDRAPGGAVSLTSPCSPGATWESDAFPWKREAKRTQGVASGFVCRVLGVLAECRVCALRMCALA